MVTKSTSTQDFLSLIAAEEGIPMDRMQPIIKKLGEDWFDTVGSLQDLSSEQLSKMGLPSRLVTLIEKRLRRVETQPTVSRADAFARLVSVLISSNPEVLRACIQTLQVIVFNILINPIDPRLKSLKLTNQKFKERVGKYPEALSYLTTLGFTSVGDSIQLEDVNYSLLQESLGELNTAAVNAGLASKDLPITAPSPAPEFDPYRSGMTTLNPSIPRIVSLENDPAVYTSKLQEMEEAKERLMRQERIERRPQVFRVAENSTAQSIGRRLEEQEPTPEGPIEDVDDALMLQSMQSILRANEENSRFQNKRKKKLELAARQKVFTKVIIRVRFPDLTLLQATFSPLESTADLYKFVREYLEQTNRRFYLYFTPPKVRISVSRTESLKEMAPASLLCFAWDEDSNSHIGETFAGDGPFLKPDFLRLAVLLE